MSFRRSRSVGQQQHSQNQRSQAQQNQQNLLSQQPIIRILRGIFQIPIITFLVLGILSIAAIILNQSQTQITILGSITLIFSIAIILIFLHLIDYFRSLFEFFVNSTNVTQFLNQSSNFFFLPEEIFIITLIRYLFLYCGVALILLMQKLIPSSNTICRGENGDYSYKDDEFLHQHNCYEQEVEPQYQGPVLLGFGYYMLIVSLILLIILLIVDFVSICNFWKQKQKRQQIFINSEQNLSLEKQKSYAIKYQFLSITLSLLKIITFCLIAVFNPNTTSLILIGSNIYFHIIIISIALRNFQVIKRVQNNPQDMITLLYYISPIESITSHKNSLNYFFIYLIMLNLPFNIVGSIIFINQQDYSHIIDFDSFIKFDCQGMQFFTICYIIVIYLIKRVSLLGQVFINQIGQEQSPDNIIFQQQITQNEQIQDQSQLNRDINNQIADLQQQNQNQFIPLQILRKNLLPPIQQNKQPYILNIKVKNSIDCTICLQQISNNQIQSIVQLICHETHIFHQKCIDEWLAIHRKCPNCNAVF